MSRIAAVAALAVITENGDAAFVGPSRFLVISTHPFVFKLFRQRPSSFSLRQSTDVASKEASVADDSLGTKSSQTLDVNFEESKTTIQTKGAFVNDGLFSWMTNFMTMYEDGKSVPLGIPMTSSSESRKASPETIALQKKEYSDNLTNIGWEERERRRQAADIFAVVTAVYVLWASLIVDQGDLQGHLLRFMSFLPLFLAVGLKKSAQSGL